MTDYEFCLCGKVVDEFEKFCHWCKRPRRDWNKVLPMMAAARQAWVARNESTRVIRENLDRLKKLNVGWMDGDGVAFDESGLDWLAKAVEKHYPEDCLFPCFFPTLEGKVLAEWFLDDSQFAPSLEIDLSQKTGDWHLLNMRTEAESERTILLDSSEGWMELASEIRNIQRSDE